MRVVALALMGSLCACASPLTVASFAGPGPELDPLRFFSGHVRSWGVVENRSGAPAETLATECVGRIEADGSLRMVQHLTYGDGTMKTREWQMRRAAPGAFEATANDMVGTGRGRAAGRAFNLRWTLATRPGDPLTNVAVDQWMYLADGGGLVIRTTLSKVGIIVAEVTEGFERVP